MTWINIFVILILFLTVLSFVIDAAYIWYMRIKQWRHRRKADARIIAQAKGAGVWDKKPIVLGGRALEIKAWQDFNIKREPGEPDAHLRRRYMAKERHDEIDAFTYVVSPAFNITIPVSRSKKRHKEQGRGRK